MESLTWCCSRKVFIVSSFLAMACFTLTKKQTTFSGKCIKQTNRQTERQTETQNMLVMQRFGVLSTEYSTSDLKFLSIHTSLYARRKYQRHVGYCMKYQERMLHNYFIHRLIYIFVRLHPELYGIHLPLLGRDKCFNQVQKPAQSRKH